MTRRLQKLLLRMGSACKKLSPLCCFRASCLCACSAIRVISRIIQGLRKRKRTIKKKRMHSQSRTVLYAASLGRIRVRVQYEYEYEYHQHRRARRYVRAGGGWRYVSVRAGSGEHDDQARRAGGDMSAVRFTPGFTSPGRGLVNHTVQYLYCTSTSCHRAK